MRLVTAIAIAVFPLIAACSDRLHGIETAIKEMDPRNEEIQIRITGTPGEAVRFDLEAMSGSESGADVFRVFWHLSHQLHASGAGQTEVELASFGQVRFIVPPDVVDRYGAEYPDQNPVYLIRTFPQYVLTPSGEDAFETWEGGWIAVTQRQMEDFNDLMRTWMLDPYIEQSEAD